MVFSSSTFLFAFLPLFLLGYFVIPSRPAKNTVLLLASLVFYAWGEPVYVVLMVVSILVNWLCALLIEAGSERMRRPALVVCVALNLFALGYFKYQGFLLTNINSLLGLSLPVRELSLPIGISFYTLQALSYVVDVYRREVPAQKNILYLGMYVCMFPQLVAGPIVRYQTIQEQIVERHETLNDFASGMRLFIVGLAKKALLANIVGSLATSMITRGGSAIGVAGAWAGLAAYSFQILFDFSGYSDMAIGLGKMLGFSFLRNFNYPYISETVSGFWRRWHISLSSFFRDYIYIPLGGNRVPMRRWVFNTAVVWFLTGFWHGAAWNYILWGLYYLALLLLERFFLNKVLDRLPGFARHLYVVIAFMFGWLLFWCEDLSVMGEYLAAMFGRYGILGSSTLWELTIWEYWPVFIACAIASTPVVPWLKDRLVQWATGKEPPAKALYHEKSLSTDGMCDYELILKQVSDAPSANRRVVGIVLTLCDVVLVGLLVISICSVVSGTFNPFIYFRF